MLSEQRLLPGLFLKLFEGFADAWVLEGGLDGGIAKDFAKALVFGELLELWVIEHAAADEMLLGHGDGAGDVFFLSHGEQLGQGDARGIGERVDALEPSGWHVLIDGFFQQGAGGVACGVLDFL